jgi:hypothetical protein
MSEWLTLCALSYTAHQNYQGLLDTAPCAHLT